MKCGDIVSLFLKHSSLIYSNWSTVFCCVVGLCLNFSHCLQLQIQCLLLHILFFNSTKSFWTFGYIAFVSRDHNTTIFSMISRHWFANAPKKSVHVKERVRKVRAKTQIFTRHCHETGMQKKNRTVQRKNYIYKYILCSMFDLIVAVVVIVDVRSKVSNRRRRRCRWFYYYAQHIRFFYYYCSPLDLIHTMLLIF